MTGEVMYGVTIDSPTSLDLDDGFCVEKTANGYRVRVAIALVVDTVAADGGLFSDAGKRAETVYYKDRSDPMLPEHLTNDVLSLMPDDEPKAALITTIDVDEQGNMIDGKLEIGAFQNLWKLSYSLAAKLVRQPERVDPVAHGIAYDEFEQIVGWIQAGYAVAQRLYARRRQNGAIAFYDRVSGMYTTLEGQLKTHGRSHSAHFLIAELMIGTNTFTTRYAAENDIPFLYRNHQVTQAVPEERTEIQAQYEDAVTVPRMLTLLTSNIGLWFRPARYSASLLGHYALNTPYATTTSPIRRFPDLICQHLLVAHLRDEPFPFDRAALDEWAETYHQIVSVRNQARSESERKKVNKEYKQMASQKDDELLALPNDKLDRLFRVWWRGNEIERIPALLTAALANGRPISLKTFHAFLFETPPQDQRQGEGAQGDESVRKAIQRTRTITLSHLNDERPMATQLLNIAQQSGMLQTLDREDQARGSRFMVRYIAQLGMDADQLVSTAQYAAALSKSAAGHEAALRFLEAYLRDELVDVEESVMPEELSPTIPHAPHTAQITPSVPFSGKSEVNKILEYCQQAKWATPLFSYVMGAPGEAHHCELIVTGRDGRAYIGEALSMTKGEAKRMACAAVLPQLPPLEKEKPQKELQTADNPISTLSMWAQQKKWKKPRYTYRREGVDNEPMFHCELVFQGETYRGMGRLKKEAKRDAAEKAVAAVAAIESVESQAVSEE